MSVVLYGRGVYNNALLCTRVLTIFHSHGDDTPSRSTNVGSLDSRRTTLGLETTVHVPLDPTAIEEAIFFINDMGFEPDILVLLVRLSKAIRCGNVDLGSVNQ